MKKTIIIAACLALLGMTAWYYRGSLQNDTAGSRQLKCNGNVCTLPQP